MRRFLRWLAGLAVWLWVRSLRLRLVVDPVLASRPGPWVLVFRHGQLFGLLRWPRPRPTAALVSLSRDGELIAGVLRRLGMVVERGSSSRGGARGLRAIVRRMRAGHDAAFAVDGPRGPLGVIHPGALAAARAARAVLVPIASACASAHVFERSWDRFELPLPFSRVAVALGAPLAASATAADLGATIDRAREAALHALEQETTETREGHGGRRRGGFFSPSTSKLGVENSLRPSPCPYRASVVSRKAP